MLFEEYSDEFEIEAELELSDVLEESKIWVRLVDDVSNSVRSNNRECCEFRMAELIESVEDDYDSVL